MTEFCYAVDYVLDNEGDEIVDNPADPGGVTKYGISLRFLRALPDARKYGFYDMIEYADVEALTLERAREIYKGEFWDHAPFTCITNQDHCNYIFDMAVNLGISPAIKCVQRAVWAVFAKHRLIADDGILGNDTLMYINQAGSYLLPAMRSERAGYYRMLGKDEFINGWLARAYGK